MPKKASQNNQIQKKHVRNFDELQAKITEECHLQDNKEDILQYVTHNNYYVLGMYWYKFRDENKNYPQLSLEELQAPYLFDQELSLLVLKYLLILENSLKSVLVNKLSVEAGHYFPHLDSNIFTIHTEGDNQNNTLVKSILNIIVNTVEPNKNKVGKQYIHRIDDVELYGKPRYDSIDDFIKNFDKEYKEFTKSLEDNNNNNKLIKKFKSGEYLKYLKITPLFVLAHFLDFREVLYLYRGMSPKLQREVAQIYGCNCENTFNILVDYMIYLRNRCAHPTRNYPAHDYKSIESKELSTLDDLENKIDSDLYKDGYLFRTLTVLQYFLKKIDPKNNTFPQELKKLIDTNNHFEFPKYEEESKNCKTKNQMLLKSMGVEDPRKIWKEYLWKQSAKT